MAGSTVESSVDRHRSWRILGPVLLLLSAVVRSGVAQATDDSSAVASFTTEGLEHSQVMEIENTLANVYGPRLTNSPAARQAAGYVMTELRSWGLSEVHEERWGQFGMGWSSERLVARVIDPRPFSLIAFPVPWTPGTHGSVTGEAVLVPADSAPDLKRYHGSLQGKFALIQPLAHLRPWGNPPVVRFSQATLDSLATAGPNPPTQSLAEEDADYDRQVAKRRQLAAALAAAGARGVVRRAGPGYGTVLVDTYGSRDPARPSPLPEIILAAEHYNRIVRLLEKPIRVTIELDARQTFYRADPAGYNVVGEIPGTDPNLRDQVVILGAHLDSWNAGTGATDNAAGVATMMEAVRLLRATHARLRRTVRIALWTGEEQGLLGSLGYVARHFGDTAGGDRSERARIAGYFNLDNGSGAIRGVYLQGNTQIGPIFKAWLQPFAGWGASTITSASTFDTDHIPFDDVGIPAFQFIQDWLDYDVEAHSNMDVFDRVDELAMKRNAIIVASFVYHAATRDERLPRKPPSGN